MSMGHRERIKGGDEQDAFTYWRRLLRNVAGRWKRAKTKFSRRVRREVREELRRGDDS